ncbi:MAG: regulatory protein RecX [Melioribacteraceae bacterium]|jgi:regulatory protein|nr:regulatory protein RecX [Melioribacteraceae bacterium]
MIISSLQKKRNDVEIFFEDGSKISLDYHVVVDNGIHKNDFLSEDKIKYLINRSELNKIKNQAFRFLSLRNHSSHELKLKLIKKKYPRELIDDAINQLREKDFINDREFAKQYIEEKVNKKRSGFYKLKAELNKKGIERELIEELLSGLDSKISLDNAFNLAKKKYDQLIQKKNDHRKLKQKIFSFLASKGFETDIILSVLDQLKFHPEEES